MQSIRAKIFPAETTNGVNLRGNTVFKNNELYNFGAYTIWVYTWDNVIIDSNYIHDIWQYGIATQSDRTKTPSDWAENITITNNTIINCSEDGIKLAGIRYSLVQGNNITVLSSSHTANLVGIEYYSADGAVDNVTVLGNTINAPGNNSIGIMTDDKYSTSVKIYNNTIIGAVNGTIIHSNTGKIIGNNITYRSNCIIDTGTGNIKIDNSCTAV